MRAAKLRWCCSARIVVGTSTATCLPASTAAKGRADRDLGLAIADVAADQSVHRLALGHVVLDRFDRRELVGRFLVRKSRFELCHPVRVFGQISKARLEPALGLDVDQLLSQVDNRLGDALFPFLPGRCADLGERGVGFTAADVFLHQVDLGDRHVKPGPLGKLEQQRFLGMLGRLIDEVQPAVTRDPVVDMDDQVAFVQVEEAVDRPAFISPAGHRAAELRRGRRARGRRSRACGRRSCGSRRIRPSVK